VNRLTIPSTRTTPREDRLTIVFSLWLVVGLFLDGYAHEELLDGGESFVTPWHAVFYSGFAATAAWIGRLAATRRQPGQSLWSALPKGYERAGLGLVLFGIGGAGDAVWHGVFGVETGIDALLSPTHLILFSGLMLILLAPWRAAGYDSDDAPSRNRAGAWSIVLATALAGFFTNYVWGLGIHELAQVPYDPVSQAGEAQVIGGVGSILVTTGVLFGSAAILLRRGGLPRWWFAGTFTLIAALVSLAFDEGGGGIVAAAVGGLGLDALTTPAAARRIGRPYALGFSAAVMWSAYWAAIAIDGDVVWPGEIWSGSIVLAALVAWSIGGVSSGDVRYAVAPSSASSNV